MEKKLIAAGQMDWGQQTEGGTSTTLGLDRNFGFLFPLKLSGKCSFAHYHWPPAAADDLAGSLNAGCHVFRISSFQLETRIISAEGLPANSKISSTLRTIIRNFSLHTDQNHLHIGTAKHQLIFCWVTKNVLPGPLCCTEGTKNTWTHKSAIYQNSSPHNCSCSLS